MILPNSYVEPSSNVYKALVATYSGLILYGLVGILVGILTIFVSYGPLWGTLWPILMLLASTCSLVGLYVTKFTQSIKFELGALFLLVILLVFYSLGIVWRNSFPDSDPSTDISKDAGALLPLIAAINPFMRMVAIFPKVGRK